MAFSIILVLLSLWAAPSSVHARLGMGAQVLTSANFEDFVGKNNKVLVDFYDPNDPRWREGQSELELAVRNVRSAGSKVPFGKVDVTKDAKLAERFVPGGHYPQLMWFLNGQPTQYHRTLRTSKAIGDFVIALDRDPMVPVASEEEAHDYVPAVFAHVSRGSPMYRTLEVVAAKHMDTVAFVFLDRSGRDELRWLGGAGVEPIKYSGEMTVSAIEKWVGANLLKSEPIPDDPALQVDEGSRVVVGKSFEQIVLQEDKDVILQVYAPWCGFCKKFAPTWKSFAQEVSKVPHLVVAKMDGSRNGSPLPETFSWDAYPKVFMVKAGTKVPIHFEGDRTVENLLEFVNSRGSKPLNLAKDDSREREIIDL